MILTEVLVAIECYDGNLELELRLRVHSVSEQPPMLI